ncbi:MAG: hypothetical protein ACKO96_02000, partial [Flammeovirgaceae bacterium]
MGREEEKWKAWMKRGMDNQDFAERQARVGKRHKEEHDDSTQQPMYDGPPTPASSSTMTAEVSPDGAVRTRPPMEPKKLDMDSPQTRPFNNWNGQCTMAEKKTQQDTTPVVESLQRTVAFGNSKAGSHETPITPHPAQYGLKETMTVVHPYMGQCSIISPGGYTFQEFRINLSNPNDVITTAITTSAISMTTPGV